jgi:hypothetical protein
MEVTWARLETYVGYLAHKNMKSATASEQITTNVGWCNFLSRAMATITIKFVTMPTIEITLSVNAIGRQCDVKHISTDCCILPFC